MDEYLIKMVEGFRGRQIVSSHRRDYNAGLCRVEEVRIANVFKGYCCSCRNEIFVETNISVLLGQTIVEITGKKGDDVITIRTEDKTYLMYHERDCCGGVEVDDVIGDLDDLLGSPILMAEEVTQEGKEGWATSTWVFYKLATNKGYVTISWFGRSSGYYSEIVDFTEVLN